MDILAIEVTVQSPDEHSSMFNRFVVELRPRTVLECLLDYA
jgi:hypothetical protein